MHGIGVTKSAGNFCPERKDEMSCKGDFEGGDLKLQEIDFGGKKKDGGPLLSPDNDLIIVRFFCLSTLFLLLLSSSFRPPH